MHAVSLGGPASTETATGNGPKRQPETELRFEPFDFVSFKVQYPEAFSEIESRVVEHFASFREHLTNREALIFNTLKSQCEKYYKTYITREIAS